MNRIKKSKISPRFNFFINLITLFTFSVVGFIFIKAESQKTNIHSIKNSNSKFFSYKKNIFQQIPFDSSFYSEQYTLLNEKLIEYENLAKENQWKINSYKNEKLLFGDSSIIISTIKKQLYSLQDLREKNSSPFFDSSFYFALKSYQLRNGLIDDGTLNKNTIHSLQKPLVDFINKIRVNIERCRFLYLNQKGDYIIVNLPDFHLFTYHDKELLYSNKVVIGKAANETKTKIFNDSIEYVVFWPYWNIPKNIIIKETLPAIKKNRNYLIENKMEVTNQNGQIIPSENIYWSRYVKTFPYLIRQRPGDKNALGKVKFLFPNRFSIYIHDTPEKKLFLKPIRAYSHGCIRLENPLLLASFLLRNETRYPKSYLNKILKKQKQTYIKLRQKTPLFITYLTCWVDSQNQIQFRPDIYQLDNAILSRLSK